jgi:hypothetical protein
MRSSFATQAQTNATQVTFYFDNGQSEAFNIAVPAATFSQQLPQLLTQPMLTFHLIDQTVIIYTAKVIKIEVKPPISQIQGEGTFPNSQRVTTMQRGATGRFPTE